MAMHELVVPRSIPIVLAIYWLLLVVVRNLSVSMADVLHDVSPGQRWGAKSAAPMTAPTMEITVEPLDGPELDRLITALLNVTGMVKQVIDTTEQPSDVDGVAFIGLVAARLRDWLLLLTEHRGDEELEFATGLLAEIAVLVGAQAGSGEFFASG
jgi:hypothetical protein